jgi:general secretion pathway protein G
MFGKVDTSKQKAAKAQISLFETALGTYRLDMGHYPTTDKGLTAMRIKPEGEETWDGPYLPKEVPLDPWGNPYEYKAPGPQGDFEIISYGADGEPGGDDKNMDIYNWKSLK